MCSAPIRTGLIHLNLHHLHGRINALNEWLCLILINHFDLFARVRARNWNSGHRPCRRSARHGRRRMAQCFAIVLSQFEFHLIDCCLSQSIVICEYDAIISREAILRFYCAGSFVWPSRKQMWTQSLDGINFCTRKVAKCHGIERTPCSNGAAVLAESSIFHFDGNKSLITNTSCVMKNTMFADFCFVFFCLSFNVFVIFVWFETKSATSHMYWLMIAYTQLHWNRVLFFLFSFSSLCFAKSIT